MIEYYRRRYNMENKGIAIYAIPLFLSNNKEIYTNVCDIIFFNIIY